MLTALLISQSVSAERSIFSWNPPQHPKEKVKQLELEQRHRDRRKNIRFYGQTEAEIQACAAAQSGASSSRYRSVIENTAITKTTPEILPDASLTCESLQTGQPLQRSYTSTVESSSSVISQTEDTPERMADNSSSSLDAVDDMDNTFSAPQLTSLLSLPPEIIYQILLDLPPISLYAASLTCKRLYTQSLTDSLWAAILAPLAILLPHPYPSYRSLHHALAPHLYLQRKLFVGDRAYFGSILISKYVPMTGCIEAYNLTVTPPSIHLAQQWSYDPTVLIHNFNPKIGLREEPDVKISPNCKMGYDGEIPLQRRGINATYFRAEGILSRDVYAQMSVWPSRTIPSDERVRNQSATGFRGSSVVNKKARGVFQRLPSDTFHGGVLSASQSVSRGNNVGEAVLKKTVEEVDNSPRWTGNRRDKSGFLSEKAFRLRKWALMGESNAEMGLYNRIRMGEQVETFAELSEELWTPTKEYPFRGIWIGDYLPHAPEFLLFHQPENTSGPKRLEVIKLTGDPNVPRGEYTFIIDDLSSDKILRTCQEDETEWPGGKVYRGRGQIAEQDFRDSSFMEVEVIVPDAGRDWDAEVERKQARKAAIEAAAATGETVGSDGHGNGSVGGYTTNNGEFVWATWAMTNGGLGDTIDEVGEGWGVGKEERRNSARRSGKKEMRRDTAWRDERWVQRRVSLLWGLGMPMIKYYRRVDVEKFFEQ